MAKFNFDIPEIAEPQSLFPSTPPALEFSNVTREQTNKLKQEISQSKLDWEASIRKRDEELFQKYSELRKFQGNPLRYKNLQSLQELSKEEQDYENFNRVTAGPVFQAPPLRIDEETGDFKELDKHRVELDKYKEFKNQEEKKRFEALSEDLKEIEITNGGVYNESLGFRAFNDSFLNGLTLGLVPRTHPIYGTEHIKRNQAAALLGEVVGQNLSFMALNMATGGLGLSGAILSATKGSVQAKTIVTATGYVPYQLARWSNGIKAFNALPLDVAAKSLAIEAAGAQTIANAFLYSFAISTRELVNKYREEDKLTKKQWQNEVLKVPVRNFLTGLGLSVVNAPQSWGTRFLADTMYETASQGVNILTGQQEDWDYGRYALNFFLGNIMGEAQGKIFTKAAPENKANILKNERTKEFYDKVRIHPDFRRLDLEEGDAIRMASTLTMMDEAYTKERNIPTSTKLRDDMVEVLFKPYGKLSDFKDQLKNGAFYKLTSEDLKQSTEQAKVQAVNMIGDYFNWDSKTRKAAVELDILNNKKEFNRLISKEIVSKDSELNKIDGITNKAMQDGLFEIQTKFISDLDSGALPKSQVEFAEILRKIDLDRVLTNQTVNKTLSEGQDLTRVDKPEFTDAELVVADTVQKNIEAYGLRSKDQIEKILKGALGREVTKRDIDDVISIVGEKNIEYFADKIKKGKDQNDIFLDIINETASRLRSGKGPYEDLSAMIFSQKERFDNEGEGVKRVGKSNIRDSNNAKAEALSDRYEILSAQPSRPGSDTQSEIIRSREFARILEVAKNDPRTMVGAIFRYLSSYKKMNIGDIKSMLRAFGISDMNERTIKILMNDATKKIPGIDSRILKNVPVKATKYTRDEINHIYDFGKKVSSTLNPITGLKSSISSPSVKKSAKTNGVYIFSFKKFYEDSLKKYGEVGANKLLNKASEIIKRNISIRSSDFRAYKDKSQIFLRNPVENNSTDFFLFSDGLSRSEFDQIAGDLFNLLNNHYKSVSEIDKDRHLIKIDNDTRIKSFDVDLSFLKDLDSAFDVSSHLSGIKRLAAHVLNANEYQRFEKIVFSLDNEGVRNAYDKLKTLINLNDTRLIDASVKSSDIKNLIMEIGGEASVVPNVLPPIRQADIYASEATALKEDKKYIQWKKSKIRARVKEELLEDSILKASKTMDVGDDDLSAMFDEANKATRQKAENLARLVEEEANIYDNKRLGPMDRFFRSGIDFLKKGKDFLHEYTTIDKDASMPMKRISYWIQDEREKITKGPVTSTMRSVYGDFFKKNFSKSKEGDFKIEIFNRLQDFSRELEFKKIVKDDQTYELQEDIYKKLKEPIKWSEDKRFDIDSILQDPNNITGQNIFDFKKATLDDLAFSKLIIKATGLSPEEYVSFMVRKDKVYYKELERLNVNQRGKLGLYKNLELFENVEKEYEKSILKGLQESRFFSQAKTIDFSNPQDLKRLALMAKDIGGEFETIVKQYLNLEPGNLSYVPHRVLADPKNQEIFKGEISTRISGGSPSGRESSSPEIDELRGRKIATKLDLIERGYKVEMNSYEVEFATLNYLYSKQFNVEIADKMKFTYLNKMLSAYSSINKLENDFIFNAKRTDINEKRKVDILTDIIQRKDEAISNYMDFFGDVGGYFYKPTKGEINESKLVLKSIEEALALEKGKSVRNQRDIETLTENYKLESEKIKKLELARSIYSGDRLVREKKALIKIINSGENKDIKLDKQAQDDRKREIELERRELVNKIATNLTAGENYLPLNKKAFISEANNVDAEKFRSLYEKIKIEDRGERAAAIPLYDGLYINRPSSRLFKQYVFRDDWGDKQTHHEFVEKSAKLWDGANHFLKTISLWNPTIMMSNNCIQAAIAEPLHKLATANHNFARKAFLERDLHNAGKSDLMTTDLPPGYNVTPHEFYWMMNKNDLFSHGVSFGDVVSDSTRLWVEMMGKDDLFGFNATLREIHKKMDPGAPDEAINERVWRYIRNTWNKASLGYQKYQEVAWTSDELVRLQVAKTQYDRFARATKPDGTPVHDKGQAAFAAAEYTNLMMVQYSNVPSSTRRQLGRFFMFPTFRIGTAKMYGAMFKDFGKGAARLFGKNSDNIYTVSSDKFEQAFFEMGPLLRTFGLKAAIKSIAGVFFGYTYVNTWDMLTGYRLRKVKDENDPFDRTMTYLSLGTPIFELEKYITRDVKTTILFNSAGVPRILHSIMMNQNAITGQPIVTAGAIGDSRKVSSQIAMYALNNYMPFGSGYAGWADADITFAQKLFNASGFGFYYSADSPNKIIEDFNAALDKSKTVKDREIATKEFNQNMKRAWRVLFNEEHKDIIELMNEAREKIEQEPLE